MVAIRLLRFSKCGHPVRHGNLATLCFEAQFNFCLHDKLSLLARSTEGGDPLRLGDAPHAFTGAVVFDAQVRGFGIVAQ